MTLRTPFRLIVGISFAAIVLLGCESVPLLTGQPIHEGQREGLPVHQTVIVFRDNWGIPYIYAANNHDLMVVLGFVHAQDRLWQMERARRSVEGRLFEVFGEPQLETDQFLRLIGLTRLRDAAVDLISTSQRQLLEAYVSGINAYLELRGDDSPIEFESVGLVPEPWEIKDVFAQMALKA